MRLVTCCVFLIACSSSGGDSTIDITHDPCAGVALRGGQTDIQRAGIANALDLWVEGGLAIGNASPSTIDVQFEAAALAFRGLYDDERSIIVINDQLVAPALSIVIAHELGHALGLPHVTDRPSVMNPANLTTPPTAGDRAAVEALWGTCDQ